MWLMRNTQWQIRWLIALVLTIAVLSDGYAEPLEDMNYVRSVPNVVPVTTDDPFLTTLYALPAWVAEVERVCPWRIDGAEGYVRVIRTEQQGIHGLYLQWIRKGIASGPTEAISTIAVEELREQYQVRVQMPKAQLNTHHCTLETMAEDIHNERRYRLIFELTTPGQYTLAITHLFMGNL